MSYHNKALPSSRKTHLEQHKQILKQLLREEANKSCADCKTSKNPRWASWSLGCLICIRCSGIHRSMGTHISKVKSVDLDAWTDDQVENMVRWGNEKSNLYWESKLPDGYIPDQLKIENFIRTKYDMKKWKDNQDIRSFNPSIIKKTVSAPATPTPAPAHTPTPTPTSVPRASPIPVASTTTSSSVNSFSSRSTLPLAPIQVTTSALTPTPPPPQLQASLINQPLQSAQSTGGSISSNGRPDLKKSILSLYSSPSSSSSFVNQQQQQQQQFQQQTRVQQSPMSFTPPPPTPTPAQTQPMVSRLDDDLFKNVWN